MRLPSVARRRAFTLIELLVVIAILGILMTLLFPAVTGALENAKKAQAKNDATQIANAIVAYNTEYNRMPVDSESQANTADLMNTLAGAKANDPANPRKITFLEVPIAKANKNGALGTAGNYSSPYLDPWGNAYEIRVDHDYDNVVTGGPNGDVRKTVIVWSTANSTEPRKFAKSWE